MISPDQEVFGLVKSFSHCQALPLAISESLEQLLIFICFIFLLGRGDPKSGVLKIR